MPKKGYKQSEEHKAKNKEYRFKTGNPGWAVINSRPDIKAKIRMTKLGISAPPIPKVKRIKRLTNEEKAGRPRPNNCEICGISRADIRKNLCYDHDHRTGKFRGWICDICNRTLGIVHDNTTLLKSMIEYLNKTEAG